MTYLATWPASPARTAGCDAFDDEPAALAFAQRLTWAGVAHVVVYEIDDQRLDPRESHRNGHESAARVEMEPGPTQGANSPLGAVFEKEHGK